MTLDEIGYNLQELWYFQLNALSFEKEFCPWKRMKEYDSKLWHKKSNIEFRSYCTKEKIDMIGRTKAILKYKASVTGFCDWDKDK